MQMVGGLQPTGSLAPVAQMSSGGGGYANSQYEYDIEGSGNNFKQGTGLFERNMAPGQPGPQPGSNKQATGGQKNSNNMPKRTPHSELTSYQSEKRLKEYKQQQVAQAH